MDEGADIGETVDFYERVFDEVSRVKKAMGGRIGYAVGSLPKGIQKLVQALNKKFGNVGVAIQANLYRSRQDLKILKRERVSVRLVKGAYKESKEKALQNEDEIQCAFFNYAADLISANKPAIGTHDEDILDDITEMLLYSGNFDYEFLYGVRRDLQKKLKDEGKKVRVYVPFGDQWLPYTMRRLKEWKNLKFVIKNIWKEWKT